MPETSNLTWLGYFIAFLAAGGFIGYARYFLEWRKAPADRALTIAQVEQIRAQIRREDESAEFSRMRELSDAAWATADRLRKERDAADVRVGQLLIERQDLKDELKHVTDQLQAAEEQLGLKVRREESE